MWNHNYGAFESLGSMSRYSKVFYPWLFMLPALWLLIKTYAPVERVLLWVYLFKHLFPANPFQRLWNLYLYGAGFWRAVSETWGHVPNESQMGCSKKNILVGVFHELCKKKYILLGNPKEDKTRSFWGPEVILFPFLVFSFLQNVSAIIRPLYRHKHRSPLAATAGLRDLSQGTVWLTLENGW